LEDETTAKQLQEADAGTKLNEALSKCEEWHSPCREMIQCTSLDTIWGTQVFLYF